MKRYLKLLYVAVSIGLVVACLGLFIGFQHNPQGEFVDLETGKVNIGYAFSIFLSWFLLSSTITVLIGSVVAFLASVLKDRLYK